LQAVVQAVVVLGVAVVVQEKLFTPQITQLVLQLH
jgi:hypothetical protein